MNSPGLEQTVCFVNGFVQFSRCSGSQYKPHVIKIDSVHEKKAYEIDIEEYLCMLSCSLIIKAMLKFELLCVSVNITNIIFMSSIIFHLLLCMCNQLLQTATNNIIKGASGHHINLFQQYRGTVKVRSCRQFSS